MGPYKPLRDWVDEFIPYYMDVSKNRGTPKSSILIGFSTINHPFWGASIFGNTHMEIWGVDRPDRTFGASQIVRFKDLHFVDSSSPLATPTFLPTLLVRFCGGFF